jgi:IS5 family transposase
VRYSEVIDCRLRDDRQDDLFRSSLEAIINLHPLVRLAPEIN